MDAGTQRQHHEHLQNTVLEYRCTELGALLREHQQLPGKVFQQHIDLAVRADGYLPEGHHVEAFFKVGVRVRKLRQRLGGQLHPNKFQRAVSTGVFQSAALTGLEDDEILLLCGQHHLAAPEHAAAPHDQKKTVRPFSMKDKIGYTLGDLGCCFTEQYRAMYLSIFYTLILQVNPFHVGILLLVTKIWDAVNDPIIGAIVDSRKATKGGKFIPWIRAFSFPMAVLCILGFVNVGNINYGLRLAYMFVTYVLYEALYTCVNVPFGTLSSVMTDDVSQRTALSRYRSLGGTIFMTVMVMIGPLFLYVDNKPVAGRFLMLACICAMLGLLCLQITCVWCKERVEVPERPQGEKLNYLHVLKEISHNKALLGVMFFSLTGMIGASVVNGLNTYLYKDFFGNVKIQAVSGMLSVLYAVLSFAITQPLANKFGKKEWCCMGAGFAAIVFGILFFFPVHNPVVFIVINGICYLGASGMQVLIWAMVNDAIDYHELQTGERNEGIVYSTYSFFRKLASAISGSLSSFVLGAIGYNVTAGAVQTAGVVNAIWKSYTGVYFLGYGIAVAILFFVYPLTKQKTAEMLTELKARRAAKESK